MTKEEADAVVQFWNGGGNIKMRSHGYVDDFAALDESETGEWSIRSEVWAPRPLLEVCIWDLTFYKTVSIEDVLSLRDHA
jgi:hypothetical protein